MMTPNDILNVSFNRSFRGFDVEEVRDFLSDVSEDIYKILKENSDLKQIIEELNGKIVELENSTNNIDTPKAIDTTSLECNSENTKAENDRLAKQNSDLNLLIREKQERLAKIDMDKMNMLRDIKEIINKHLEICKSYEQ